MSRQSNGDRESSPRRPSATFGGRLHGVDRGKQDPKRASTASVTSLVRHPVTKLREAIRPLDVQRVDGDLLPTKAFVDFANVGIGIYAAANNLPLDGVLSIGDRVAANSTFAPGTTFDPVYTHTPLSNVWDIKLGYSLVTSGQLRSGQ